MRSLSARSRDKLRGVHPDLVRVVERAAQLCPFPFEVTEGLRTLERQKQLKAQGLSQTLNSRHLTGHAVDIVPAVDVTGDGKVTGEDMWHHSQLVKLSPYIKQAFAECSVPYEWGGDWKNAWDKPHWQLPWRKYPVRTASVGPDFDLMEAFVEDPMETPPVTPNAAAMIGKGSAGAGGVALATDAIYEVQRAEGHFNAGNIFGLILGTLIIVGAGLALYSQWDDMGRPVPSVLKKWGWVK